MEFCFCLFGTATHLQPFVTTQIEFCNKNFSRYYAISYMSPQNINTKLVMFSILVLTKFEFFTIVYYTCNFMYIPPTSAQRRQSTELYSVFRFSPQIVFHLPLLPSHFTSRMRLVGTRHLVSVSEELLRSWLLPLIQYLSTQPIYLQILK